MSDNSIGAENNDTDDVHEHGVCHAHESVYFLQPGLARVS